MAHRLREHFADREEVAERLRHLLVVDVDEAVVHPDLGEAVARGRAGLGDLVLVVRKLQVEAAAVDVEMRAEERHRHGGALDVPARSPLAPWRVPGRLAGLGVLPQHEIEWIALGLVDLDPGTGAQIRQPLAGEPAVALELRHRIHDIAVRGEVGVAARDELLDHGDDGREVFGGARLEIRAHDPERIAILVHRGDESRRESADRLAVRSGAVDDPVVDIRDIAHVRDAVARGAASISSRHQTRSSCARARCA